MAHSIKVIGERSCIIFGSFLGKSVALKINKEIVINYVLPSGTRGAAQTHSPPGAASLRAKQ